MDKKTFEALKVLVAKIELHVAPATYQEDTREAVAVVKEWMDEYEKEYGDCNTCGNRILSCECERFGGEE
jgi:hypothetical protein